MPYQPPALYVAWRNSDTRRIYPVGRLLRLVEPAGYEFAYIEGALVASQNGFQPFLAFPDLHKLYRSHELLPFFKNRILSRSRPEYAGYVAALDLALDAAETEPMTLLAVSGGRRATDLVELFPDWSPDASPASSPSRGISAKFLLRGVQYIAGAEERIQTLRAGDRLRPVPDVKNAVNPRAVKLHTDDDVWIGFVPDYLASRVRQLLDGNVALEVRVQRVNPPPVPSHERVLCILSAQSSVDPVAFRDGDFRPLAADATHIDDRAGVVTPIAAG
ncbi:MAG TPA: HIRAN domain-containing protein [Polyangiaceae bacterium]|nr:HIRAN domain-containing protein [Polyangiaceae bacterium]